VDAEDFSQEVVRAAVEGRQGDLAATGAEVGVASGGGAATGVDSGLGVPRVDEEVEAGTVGAGIDAARRRMYNRCAVAGRLWLYCTDVRLGDADNSFYHKVLRDSEALLGLGIENAITLPESEKKRNTYHT
jgi:hypothetical protein